MESGYNINRYLLIKNLKNNMENNMDNISQKTNSSSGIGPIVGSIIVIAVVVVGGIYFWGSKIAKDKQTKDSQGEIIKDFEGADLISNDIDANLLSIPKEDPSNFEEELLNF